MRDLQENSTGVSSVSQTFLRATMSAIRINATPETFEACVLISTYIANKLNRNVHLVEIHKLAPLSFLSEEKDSANTFPNS